MSNPSQAELWISAASPLLTYSLSKGETGGSSWMQLPDGSNQCLGQEQFTIELPEFYFTNIAFIHVPTAAYQIIVGLDGSSDKKSGESGMVSLSTSFGTHSAKLDCQAQTPETFIFHGVQMQTQVVVSGSASNNTIDDASSLIRYNGFQSTSASKSDISAIQNGNFYEKTVSYTSSGGASASFACQGSAFYIMGMTGPGFGSYQVSVDSKVAGTYNASTTIETYNTLLYFTTYLDSSQVHQISITNQYDGLLFALDYVICVTSESPGNQSNPTATATASNSGATAVFPSQGTSTNSSTSGDNGGAVIGGILGTLGGLFCLWVLWRYRQWKKAGGDGSFMAALCGGMRMKKEPKKEETKFHLWPIVGSRPKYAT
ncbi:hypothetical protein V865_004233 [Kwoniella europaea PYCC6329]|uniref:Peptidase A1 domain-containing protein n=1 Tax=Kwoniella europaea PYCC6329 TaxID=1423913 RepID=A0AAX4KJA2_9TREE